MIEITVNNKRISLEKDFSLRLQWINPACVFDGITGDVGVGISIPVNEINRSILGNPERFEKYASASSRKFPASSISYKGTTLLSGTLVVTDAGSESYNCWLQSGVGVMGETQRDRFINEMEWRADNTFENKTTYSETNGDEYATVEIINPVFWEGVGRETTVEIFFYDENNELDKKTETWSVLRKNHRDDYGFKVNMPLNNGLIKTDGPAPVVSPHLFFNYAIAEMLRMNGFYVNNNFFDTDNYPAMVVYNNYNILKYNYTIEKTEGIIYPKPWLNEDAIITPNAISLTKVVSYDWTLQPFTYSDLVPRVPMKDVLLGIQNMFNVVFVFGKNRKVDIVDRNKIFESEAIDLDKYFAGVWYMGERSNISLKFITEYDDNDAMFGQEYHDVTERRYQIKDPVADMDALEAIPEENREIGEIRLVESLNKYYEWKWDTYTELSPKYTDNQINVLQWVFISNGPQAYLYGTAEEIEEIKTTVSTIQLETYQSLARKPTVMQKGNMSHMRNVWNNFTFRLLFYAGGHFGGPTTSNGEYSLNWEGNKGLFEKRWKNWARLWSTRQPVEAEFDLPLNMLVHVSENITGKFRTRHGEFIIEQAEVEIGSNMIGKTKIRGYKL